ncbi:MBL fold metallo-hydrolase [Heyndrickxia coagulans]|uniref:Glyoxylase, beta-lactamase superfamily II n=1 Tax=Heyndrickxia coagulans DSM 1 = ATCC 7050 TaxID=1121088 RepID=A0A8B4BVD0_HEYCO|nr:MBL fold metallo-hydrolase [Heyndrickxia coagulans]MED4535832.1 MBL fold metallo-hydrolase [Heyndrickxia coagulans]SHF20389.1 Glyoxylase, beta-lactamase superfamily II [Heyndrickxia coagulans DSM 1 = ATCC 7050]
MDLASFTEKKDSCDFTKVAENVWKLVVRFPFGMREVNCYLFKGEKGYTIVDTGDCHETAKETWNKVLASVFPIEKIVLTHSHPDHLGLAKWLKEKYSVPVFMSDLSFQAMQETKARFAASHDKYEAVLQKHGGPALPKRNFAREIPKYDFEPDGLFKNGEQVLLGDDPYEAIRTPGHAPDHFCFYNRKEQILVLGDHVLKDLSPIVAAWSENDKNPLGDYFDSLDRIKDLPAKVALPGHGGLIGDVKARAESIRMRHEHRLKQMTMSLQEGEKTAAQICRDTYGDVALKQFFAPFMTTITRCLYLESAGKISSRLENGKILYFLP